MAPTMITPSHQAILPFRLHRPATVEEALGTAAAPDGRLAYMAGGLDLVPAMRAGERVTDLVFLPGIPALRHIVRADGVLRIGACVTHHQFESDPLVALACHMSHQSSAVVSVSSVSSSRKAGAVTYFRMISR